ncbi:MULTISPECIES: hypothetical protein [unclassified Actinobaculum]|uniref:hypothetical protein n=1 Tax=unclassified Actinobaculum TaxID=2609299 RepID=UPI000D527AA8|nr:MULTISPECIES: hypothetical protein [unclassified Actinobaculum]AWE41768.1 hypothetical protein DDD63_02220 [Actinobaculum sp. 313]RTE50314.1 hypothetical protein EKN07_03680 [Actinobaculum sp. 352]
MASREQRDTLAEIATFDPNEAQDLANRLSLISEGFEGLRLRINGMLNPDDWGIRGATADAMLSSLEWVRNRLGDHADDTEAMGKSVQVIADATIQARAAHEEISAGTQASDTAYKAEVASIGMTSSMLPTPANALRTTAGMEHAEQAHEARDAGYEERAGRMVDYVGEEVDRAIRMLPRSEKAEPRSYVTYAPPLSGVDSSVTGLPSDGGASYAAALAEGRPTDTDPDLDVSDGGGSVVPSVGAIAAGVGVSGSLAWMFSWYAGERVEGMVGTPQGRMIRADSAEARYLYGPGGGDLMDRVREAGRLSFQDNNNPTGGAAGAAAGAAGAAGLARGAASGVRWSNAQQMGMRPTRIPLSGQPQQATGTGARGTGTGTRGTGVRGGQAQQAGMRGTGGVRGGQAQQTGARGGQAAGGRGTGVRGGQPAGGRAGTGRGAGTGGVRGGQTQQSGRGTGRAGTGVRGGQAQQTGVRGAGVRGAQGQQSGVRGAGVRGAGRKRDERERKWSPEVRFAMRGREVPDPQEEERRKEEALKRLDAVWLSRHGAESIRERERREAEEATRREMFSRPLLYWREPRENEQQQ